MKHSKFILTALFLIGIFCTTSAQITLAGVTMPPVYKLGNNNLVLNGAGIRQKLWIDVYVAGLYISAKSKDGDAICRSNEPSAVTLHIVSGLVTSEKMVDAVREGFKKSTGGKTAPLQARIDRFVKVFMQEPIVKTNSFDMVYIPAEGLKIYKGSKLLETIEGQDFKTALWGIWLGAEPVDKDLKTGMLGISK